MFDLVIELFNTVNGNGLFDLVINRKVKKVTGPTHLGVQILIPHHHQVGLDDSVIIN